MSFSPKVFSDLGKSASELFKQKKFDLKQSLQIKTSTTDPKATIKVLSSVDKGAVSTELTGKYTIPSYGKAELTLKDSGNQKLKLENSDGLVDGLTIKAEGDSEHAAKLTAKYTKDFVATQADVEYSKDGEITISPSVVVGFDGFSIGLTAKLEPNAKDTFADYNCAFEYAKDALTVTAKTERCADVINSSVHHKFNSDVALGLGFSYNLSDDAKSATVGGTYQMTKNMEIRAKLDTSGMVNAVLTHRLSESASLKLGSQFDIGKFGKDTHRLGIRLELGDDD